MDPRVQRTVSGSPHEATLRSRQGPGPFHLSTCYPGPSSQGWQLSHDKMTAPADCRHRLPQACLSWRRDRLTSCSSFLRARKLFYPSKPVQTPHWHKVTWICPPWTIPGRGVGYLIGLCQQFSKFLALGPFFPPNRFIFVVLWFQILNQKKGFFKFYGYNPNGISPLQMEG